MISCGSICFLKHIEGEKGTLEHIINPGIFRLANGKQVSKKGSASPEKAVASKF